MTAKDNEADSGSFEAMHPENWTHANPLLLIS
jgi:hypothetical protein